MLLSNYFISAVLFAGFSVIPVLSHHICLTVLLAQCCAWLLTRQSLWRSSLYLRQLCRQVATVLIRRRLFFVLPSQPGLFLPLSTFACSTRFLQHSVARRDRMNAASVSTCLYGRCVRRGYTVRPILGSAAVIFSRTRSWSVVIELVDVVLSIGV